MATSPSRKKVRNALTLSGVMVFGGAGADPSIAAGPHFAAVLDQVALALETHRLHSDLREAMASLQAAQREMVKMEKLRAASTLAATIAHDIRNILTPLQVELAEMPGETA